MRIGSTLRPRRIAVKLAGALAVPLLDLNVIAVLEVADSKRAADDVREEAELARAAVGPKGLIASLIDERNYAAVWLVGTEETAKSVVSSNDDARQATDAALTDFSAEVERLGGAVGEVYAPALEGLNSVVGTRGRVDEFVPTARDASNIDASAEVFDNYTAAITSVLDAHARLESRISDPVLRQGVRLIDTASRQIDLMARLLQTLVFVELFDSDGAAGPDRPGIDQRAEIAEVATLMASIEANQAMGAADATGAFSSLASGLDVESGTSNLLDTARVALTGSPVRVDELPGIVTPSSDTGWFGFRSRAESVLAERADGLSADAASLQRRYLVLAALAMAAALAVTWPVARSITRPLRELTRQAMALAERDLPAAVRQVASVPLGRDVELPALFAIEVHSRDEVADLADALNTVQESALELAVEQAVLRRNIADSLVNLGRRNQNILGRQLDFITELESDETDPDALAQLFRLDHLATRMRRNAASLLVLAGVDPPRQWRAPVQVADVVRAALGEVEDYQRVNLRGVAPAMILGSAAAALAHLVAEMVENALAFSTPHQLVDIVGDHRRDGVYVLAAVDSGIGMSPDAVARANRRLAGAESFTVAPSRYLGHYVAGMLAARHGIRVHLDESPGRGITATIEIPITLLDTAVPRQRRPLGRRSAASGIGGPPRDA